jgi:hypothetical protein
MTSNAINTIADAMTRAIEHDATNIEIKAAGWQQTQL